MPANSGLVARHRAPRNGGTPDSRQRPPTVVIGARPHGLATAAWPSAAGTPRRVFGEPIECRHERRVPEPERQHVRSVGQSALESAALPHEAGARPTVIVRAESVAFGSPPDTGRLRPVRIVKPGSPPGPGWSRRSSAAGGPSRSTSTRRPVASSRWPRLSSGFESSVAGLFFTGPAAAAPTFGPVPRFAVGTGFAARRVAGSVAARTRAHP